MLLGEFILAKMIRKRLLQIGPILFVLSIISFLLIKLAPGDPIRMYVTPSMKPEDIDRIREGLGLNDPIYIQYFNWVLKVLQGDFGYSIRTSQPVFDEILVRILPTLGLMGAAILLTLAIAIPLGLLAAKYENRLGDRLLNLFAYIGISIPSFWLGILLIILFAIKLQWLPTMGMRTIGVESIPDLLKHSILPVAALTFHLFAVYYRYVRSSTISELKEDYVDFQRAKGLSENEVVRKHVLKNVLLPIITLLGMSLPSLISGAFIIEKIFSWPGMGTYGIDAIFGLDYPVIMAITLMSGLLLIIGNLLADITYQMIDPRIRK